MAEPGVDRTAARLAGYKVSNMLISLGVMFAIVVLAVVIVPRRNFEAVKVVSPDTYDAVLSAAQSTGLPFRVFVPVGLPASWRATSIRLDRPRKPGDTMTLHIGYYTPTQHYASLEESTRDRDEFVARLTISGQLDGLQLVNGLYWIRHRQPERDVNALVRYAGRVTIVVVGNSSFDELAVLGATLR